MSLLHATLIAEATKDLDLTDEEIAKLTDRVLCPMPDGSRPTHITIRRRLTRAVTSAQDPAQAHERRRRAVARRGLDGQLTEEGTGILTLHTTAERLVAIMDRVEQLARRLRQSGDPRSLDQLRSDLASDALLQHGYGSCPAHAASTPDTPGAPSSPDPRSTDPSSTDPSAAEAGGPGEPCGCAPPGPPASVWIVVPFEVATGSSDAACEIPGHGWVTAAHAREIITAPGSQWQWLAVDRLTGRALELGTKRYRPTPAMVRQVRALDGHCRAPGCTVPAHRCDLDHHVPYPTGPTTTTNLGALHRAHHNARTAGLWQCTPVPEEAGSAPGSTRALGWHTLAGRDYVTYPKSWTEALEDPPHPPGARQTRRPPPEGPPPF